MVIGSAENSAGRRWRPGSPSSGGKRARMSDADEETKSAAGQRNPSGRKGSGGAEELGCAGGVEEKVTSEEGTPVHESYGTKL